jgi:hypothetical protein
MEKKPHPLTEREDICRATFIGATGIEWVCINQPHNPGYERKASDYRHQRGAIVKGTGGHQDGPMRGFSAPLADRHHYVNRWPNRKTDGAVH